MYRVRGSLDVVSGTAAIASGLFDACYVVWEHIDNTLAAKATAVRRDHSGTS
jgi:hypothetical protein